MIHKQLRRFSFAFFGIWHALKNDFSYRLQVLGGAAFLAIFIYFTYPLSQTEYLFLGLGWVLILITELQNSAFEEALDHIHPELHDKIGRSKDMAAGSVLTAGFFFLFVVVSILLF